MQTFISRRFANEAELIALDELNLHRERIFPGQTANDKGGEEQSAKHSRRRHLLLPNLETQIKKKEKKKRSCDITASST